MNVLSACTVLSFFSLFLSFVSTMTFLGRFSFIAPVHDIQFTLTFGSYGRGGWANVNQRNSIDNALKLPVFLCVAVRLILLFVLC